MIQTDDVAYACCWTTASRRPSGAHATMPFEKPFPPGARVFAGDGFLFGVRHYKGHDKDRFSEFRTGMDHMAFAVPDRAALAAFEARLEELGTTYTPTAETPYGAVVVFRDPDGIQIEFFVTANGS